ncbi:MAG: hypothetical protein HOV81_30150 [Kofleriaceae bacterium]|nr:hypothetical protein [Kofleriaceae bacterium]
MYIARIPLDQKGAVVETQNQWSVAKMENANAEANSQEADAQLHQAQNDHKAARLSVDSAISAKKSAEQSADMNRINNAQKDLKAAEDSSKAAEMRVKYFEAYRNYLRRYMRYTQENMYWYEAKYEVAKSSLAQRNNIAIKNVDYNKFPQQVEQRGARTQKAKERAEAEKSKALQARQAWLSAQQAADKLTGRTGSMFDPMAPPAQPTTAGGGGGAAIQSNVQQGEVKPLSNTPAPTTGGGDAPQQNQ